VRTVDTVIDHRPAVTSCPTLSHLGVEHFEHCAVTFRIGMSPSAGLM